MKRIDKILTSITIATLLVMVISAIFDWQIVGLVSAVVSIICLLYAYLQLY